jgi:hypothetical protein
MAADRRPRGGDGDLLRRGVRRVPPAGGARLTRRGTDAEEFARQHVAAFNDAVARGDFSGLLARFTDDAVMRFENVPGAGTLEFAGRDAYTLAYERQPPDDAMDVVGPMRDEDGAVVIPFAWRRDGAPGEMRLTLRDERICRAVVVFA